MKSTPFDKLVSTLLGAAILIVVANAALAFHAEQILADSEFWVAHTWQVIAGLDHVMGRIKDAETGARGYLITGDASYLVNREVAMRSLPAELAELKHLVQDNPPQERRMTEMATVAMQRMDLITYTVGVRRDKGQEAAFALVREGAGIREMDRLGELVARMQKEEHTLLGLRQEASSRARIEGRLTVAFASALDVVFIVLTVWSLGYERRLRHQAAETTERLEKLQAISDIGLTQLSLSELTDEMLERLRRVASIDAIALFSWESNEVAIIAAKGLRLTPERRLGIGPEDPLARCGRENRILLLNGAEITKLGIEEFAEQMQSVLILPLSISDRVIAVVVAARCRAQAFTAADEQLLSIVADRIAISIDRATLFESERTARLTAESANEQVQLLNAELEERVSQRTAELEATNRELEAFSYSVSHDLRAPLRSVDGFSVALEEDFGALLTGESRHYLSRIRAGVQRMGQLIDALLQLSRITRAELVVEPVSLSGLALDVARELEQQNPSRRLLFKIAPGLAAQADPRLLRAVFENMLGNAVKFTANADQAEIEFDYSPERGAYFIRDNGAGFDQRYADKLFVAFQRLHGEKDFKGSGIGLATVARVINRHHGTMSAEGVVGGGATFWFTLGTP